MNVEVGDKLLHSERVGVPVWGGLYYPMVVITEVTVERTTATQFTAGGVRYFKKYGDAVGANRKGRLVSEGEPTDPVIVGLHRKKVELIEKARMFTDYRILQIEDVDDAVTMATAVIKLNELWEELS